MPCPALGITVVDHNWSYLIQAIVKYKALKSLPRELGSSLTLNHFPSEGIGGKAEAGGAGIKHICHTYLSHLPLLSRSIILPMTLPEVLSSTSHLFTDE